MRLERRIDKKDVMMGWGWGVVEGGAQGRERRRGEGDRQRGN
jgi:hypothetical protein